MRWGDGCVFSVCINYAFVVSTITRKCNKKSVNHLLHDWFAKLITGFLCEESIIIALASTVDEFLAGIGFLVEEVHRKSCPAAAVIGRQGTDDGRILLLLLLTDDMIATHSLTLFPRSEVVVITMAATIDELFTPACLPVVEESRKDA